MARKKYVPRRLSQSAKEHYLRLTPRHSQYFVYLYLYRRLHRYGLSETEISEFFRGSAPSVHRMLVKLEENGLITRELGVSRSVPVAVSRREITPLDDDDVAAAQQGDQSAKNQIQIYTLQNRGAAPCYQPFRLAIRLTRSQGHEILLTSGDLCPWLPGDNLYAAAVAVPAGTSEGQYDLVIGIPEQQTN